MGTVDYLDIMPFKGDPNLFVIVRRGKAGKIPVPLQGLWQKKEALKLISTYNEKK